MSNDPQPPAPEVTKPGSKEISKKKGCLILVIGFIVLITIINAFNGPSVSINGSTAHLKFKADAAQSPTICGGELANSIWTTAKEHPELTKIEVTVILTNETITDQYGNKEPEPYIMGELTIDNLSEVRKYKEQSMYWHQEREWFAFKISDMRYARFFRGK